MSIPEGYNFIKHLVEQGRAIEVFEIIEKLRKSDADLQAKLFESDRINRELLALSNRQASTIRSLTKAGDVMADFINPNPTAEMWGEEQAIKQAWENAKEDTQS
jgi:hypothetical protein